MKTSIWPWLLMASTPAFLAADTLGLSKANVSVNGKVTYRSGTFTIELEGGKKVPIDASDVRLVRFNSERAAKKPPSYSFAPIKRGLEQPPKPKCRVNLRSGASETGTLEMIDDEFVRFDGKERPPINPIRKSNVAAITVLADK